MMLQHRCPSIFVIHDLMQFRKRLLASHISFIVSAGLLTLSAPGDLQAQSAQLSCRANDNGDGWVCEPLGNLNPGRPVLDGNRYRGNVTISQDGSASDTPPVAPAAEPQVSEPTPLPPRNTSELDWVDRSELTEAELANLPQACCGAFIDPLKGLESNAATGDVAETLLDSTLGFIQSSDGSLSIEGPVEVRQGSQIITNDQSTVINKQDDTVLMTGNVVFREPGVLLRGNNAYMDKAEDSNRVGNASYVLHNYGTHGSADSIIFNSANGQVTIENGEFSRCEPDSNFWRLEARTILLDQAISRGYARGAKLKIKDVPVFYYPFTLTFPLGEERISGLLAPSTGSTDEGGFDFALPYYLNLAPHYDATITPRLISDRGIMASVEARYLASWSMNTLNLSLLDNDKLYQTDSGGAPLPESPPTDRRWFVGYEHVGALGRNWSTYVDYNAVSDSDYFRDLGSSGLNVASRTNLNRQGRLDFNSTYLQAGVNVQRIQLIDPLVDPAIAATDLNRPFDRLPQLTVATQLPLPGALQFDVHGEFSHFDRQLQEDLLSPAQLAAGALVNGDRVNLEPTLTLALEAPGWFLRPAAGYRYISYRLDHQAAVSDAKPDVGVGVYSLDSGLIFERDMARDGFTQTLEPRLYYLRTDYADQSRLPLFDSSEFSFSFSQLFRNDRFSGGDRVGDANQLSVAVTSRFLDARGEERGRLSVGQIRYFEDRQVSLANPLQAWVPRYSPLATQSALAGEASYAFSDSWRVNLDLQWDEEDQDLDEGVLQFRHEADNGRILNLSYRYRDVNTLPGYLLGPDIDPRIKQTDLSAALPLNSNWRFLGRWNYDHSNSRNLESFVGVEFSNCCATVRLIGREWVDEDELFLPGIKPKRGIFFQFTLHGLGNITGGGVSSLLGDGIYGFRDPYQQ